MRSPNQFAVPTADFLCSDSWSAQCPSKTTEDFRPKTDPEIAFDILEDPTTRRSANVSSKGTQDYRELRSLADHSLISIGRSGIRIYLGHTSSHLTSIKFSQNHTKTRSFKLLRESIRTLFESYTHMSLFRYLPSRPESSCSHMERPGLALICLISNLNLGSLLNHIRLESAWAPSASPRRMYE